MHHDLGTAFAARVPLMTNSFFLFAARMQWSWVHTPIFGGWTQLHCSLCRQRDVARHACGFRASGMLLMSQRSSGMHVLR